MKKLLSVLVCVVIIMSALVVSVSATESTATLTGPETTTKGSQVEYTVSIEGCPDASSAAVNVSFGTGFSLVSGTWLKDGGMNKFFDDTKKGALGLLSSPDLNGNLFKLTLQADTASTDKQTVSINVIVKNGEDEIFNKTATKEVTINCGSNHTLGDIISQVDAKCGVAGKKAYYQCSVCSKLFDESKQETPEASLVIPALEHQPASSWTTDDTYHWKVCTRLGCGAIIESTKAEHSFEWKTDKEANEDEAGLKHEECLCGKTRNEDTPIPKLDHVHIGITKHNAVAATCIKKGTKEYWTCASPKCEGKYYSDSKCQNEITNGIETDKNPNNHVGSTTLKDDKAATCCESGYTGDTYCDSCKEKISTGKVINPTGKHTDKDGKWETDGTNHWHTCYYGTKFDVNKHTGGTATCKDKAVCSVCKVEYGSKNTGNHTGGTTVKDKKTATCYAEGYTGDTYCLGCDTKIQTGSSIKKTAHTPAGNYTSDATNHWIICSVSECQAVIEGTTEAHNFKWVVDKPATKSEAGSKHEECTVCKYKKTAVPIPVLTHTHIPSFVEAKESTCKEKGNVAYWTCSDPDCEGKFYSEETLTLEYESVELPINPDNHVHTEIRNKKDSTCKEKGYSGDVYCLDCEQTVSIGKETTTAAHKFENGKCTVCGEKDPNYESGSPLTADLVPPFMYLIVALVLLSGIAITVISVKKFN